MNISVSVEVNVFFSCFVLGLLYGVIYDFFKSVRWGKKVKNINLVLQDVLYYIIISVLTLCIILKINSAQIRGYMPIAVIISFIIYRLTLSRYIVRIFIWLNAIVKYIIKLLFSPVIYLCKIIILPFSKIKRKLLSKKTKIALTFKQFCFKIKCNVGILCTGEIFCKERKLCRRKRKPGKKV